MHKYSNRSNGTEIPTIIDPSATINYPSATINYPSATINYPSATIKFPSATGSIIVRISAAAYKHDFYR